MKFEDYGIGENGNHYLYLRDVSDNNVALLQHLGFEPLDCNKSAVIGEPGLETWVKYGEDWIPVSEGYPDDIADVQVTYIGHNSGAPLCDAFAYRAEGEWYWSLGDDKVRVEITAWKRNCEAYK